jgi:acetyl-CoA carboxylase biotin carboxyl carrier protein
MDLNELKKLIKMVDESQVSEIEIEQDTAKTKGRFRIRISKNPSTTIMTTVASQPAGIAPGQMFSQTASPVVQFESLETQQRSSAERPPDVVDMGNFIEIKSPIVGTFYRSPSPDSESYVQIDSIVKPGQTLCIIEAMKIMNEIECEVTGKVSKILVENAQPVEYNQTLFLIEKL